MPIAQQDFTKELQTWDWIFMFKILLIVYPLLPLLRLWLLRLHYFQRSNKLDFFYLQFVNMTFISDPRLAYMYKLVGQISFLRATIKGP